MLFFSSNTTNRTYINNRKAQRFCKIFVYTTICSASINKRWSCLFWLSELTTFVWWICTAHKHLNRRTIHGQQL